MSSRIVEIADAIVTSLVGADFSQDFTPVRKWIVEYSLVELATLRVTVVPGPATYDPINRNQDDQRHEMDIGVQQKIDPATNEPVDVLVELMEEIIEHFRPLSLSAGSVTVRCIKRELIAPDQAAVDPKILKEKRAFTGVIRTTWMVMS